ncbi:MAG: tetratricopeptide repeat protein, partial [Ignavibacteriaceae bacterium]
MSKEINLPDITILKKITILIYILIFSVIFGGISLAQDSTRSLAFKNNKPFRRSPYFYRPDLGYQIWQQFKLTQEANSGDVLAQHELGLRYLLGEGTTADTTKAVYWISKAAEQKLPSAMYNYAILLINGWGVDWDPFSAFNYFKGAAKAGMIQAQYVVGILYTDNLIVKRDLNYAYYWVQKSADEGYEPAEDVVLQI